MDTVSVKIAKPRCVFLTPVRGHPAAKCLTEVFHRLVGQVFHQPISVAADIDVHRAAPRRFSDVHHSLVIDTQSDRIHHLRLSSPKGQLQTLCRRRLGSGFGGQGRLVHEDHGQREAKPKDEG